jgi:class 3 adenylate cyclase
VAVDEAAFAGAGLYDPSSPTAADRLALLRHLTEQGFTLDEMMAADRDGRLTALSVERLAAAGGIGGLTLSEVAERTGLAPELVERTQRALGLPPVDGPIYDERATEAFAAAAAFFGTDEALQFTRVLGSSIARLLDAAVSLFVTEFVSEATSELELTRSGEDATRLLLSLPDTIAVIFPAFVSDAVRRLRANVAPVDGGIPIAVGFVDLVGSTSLVQRLSGPDLARAVGQFETAAYDLALSHDSRVVKFVGDEAMFVSPDPAAACALGVGLCEVVDAHPLLDRAHGAVGLGPAVAQSGDYYGPLVTMVARLTGVATPGQLLGTAPLATAVTADGAPYTFESTGSHALRGFADPVEAFTVSRR